MNIEITQKTFVASIQIPLASLSPEQIQEIRSRSSNEDAIDVVAIEITDRSELPPCRDCPEGMEW